MPGVRIDQWRGQFEAAGWHVRGGQVRPAGCAEAFARPGGDGAARLDRPDAQRAVPVAVRAAARRSCATGSSTARRPRSPALLADVPDGELAAAASPTWAGTTWTRCSRRYAQCDAVTDRPSVIFAYTVKGWGLPIAGNPRNHSALLTAEQVDDAARRVRAGPRTTEWDRLDPASAGRHRGPSGGASAPAPRAARAAALASPCRRRPAYGPASRSPPRRSSAGCWSTCPGTRRSRRYLVTTAPDVATSTNLAGFINRTGRLRADASSAPGATDPLLRGPRARPASTSSWASRR